jgi:hypothetical protein
MMLTQADRRFLRAVGISPAGFAFDAEESSHDPTLDFMLANNLPLARANYLAVAYMGNPPKELDAEAELMTSGDCDEPHFTTRSGIPICSKCGKSTRNRNTLVCAPARTGLDCC